MLFTKSIYNLLTFISVNGMPYYTLIAKVRLTLSLHRNENCFHIQQKLLNLFWFMPIFYMEKLLPLHGSHCMLFTSQSYCLQVVFLTAPTNVPSAGPSLAQRLALVVIDIYKSFTTDLSVCYSCYFILLDTSLYIFIIQSMYYTYLVFTPQHGCPLCLAIYGYSHIKIMALVNTMWLRCGKTVKFIYS